MRRCWRLTKNLKRFGCYGHWRLFCGDHKKQLIIWIVFFIFTIGKNSASLHPCYHFPHHPETINNIIYLNRAGLLVFDLSPYHKAIGYPAQTPVISREIGDRKAEESRLGKIGSAYFSLGQYAKAIELYNQALAIFEVIKSPYAAKVRQLLDEVEGKEQ